MKVLTLFFLLSLSLSAQSAIQIAPTPDSNKVRDPLPPIALEAAHLLVTDANGFTVDSMLEYLAVVLPEVNNSRLDVDDPFYAEMYEKLALSAFELVELKVILQKTAELDKPLLFHRKRVIDDATTSVKTANARFEIRQLSSEFAEEK
ncbi:hypothetical protein [Enterovibrio norvegicus]|uniref:hypothetical protein n=1 Tax=Enterovibrio norvegicus TaxID=188144 RepID=UPI00352EA1E3